MKEGALGTIIPWSMPSSAKNNQLDLPPTFRCTTLNRKNYTENGKKREDS